MILSLGVFALIVKITAYVYEKRSHWWTLAFALGCATVSLYAVLTGAWLFVVLEGLWACISFSRWVKRAYRHHSLVQYAQREVTHHRVP